MKIIEHTYAWRGSLSRRVGSPKSIPLHHSASAQTTTVAAIHRWHLAIPGYRGIGYHYVVYPNGSIHRGRPEWAYGGHTLNANNGIGICFIGNFEKHSMPAAQAKAGRELVADIRRRRGRSLPAPGHREVPGNSTACPGKRFPYKLVREESPPKPKPKPPKRIALTDESITVPRMYKPGRAGWWNLGLVRYIDRVRAQGDGARVVAGDKDPLIIPVPVKRPRWWGKLYRWKKKNRQ